MGYPFSSNSNMDNQKAILKSNAILAGVTHGLKTYTESFGRVIVISGSNNKIVNIEK